jgi:iron-sulfur cluster repair protein YtfE (RIC family)
MTDLKVLTDDHAVLGSQVAHVMSLLKAFDEEQPNRPNLQVDVIRQANILQNQLAEHFALEEVMAFPHLEDRYPELAARLEALLVQHDYILDTFEQFYAVLNGQPSLGSCSEVLSTGAIFQKAFEQHAAAESQLLSELSSLGVAESDGS